LVNNFVVVLLLRYTEVRLRELTVTLNCHVFDKVLCVFVVLKNPHALILCQDVAHKVRILLRNDGCYVHLVIELWDGYLIWLHESVGDFYCRLKFRCGPIATVVPDPTISDLCFIRRWAISGQTLSDRRSGTAFVSVHCWYAVMQMSASSRISAVGCRN